MGGRECRHQLSSTLKGKQEQDADSHVCPRLTPCLHAHNGEVGALILKGVQAGVIYTGLYTNCCLWTRKSRERGSPSEAAGTDMCGAPRRATARDPALDGRPRN